ncbi:MAG: flagellar biosynthetic protein FliO [Candidatus Azotimanducaceae bacterium]|jgi:flagellar biosynthetic protein FliO
MDGQITQVAITLSGILLLIVTLGFVAKRANKSGLLGAGAMRVVASLNLGVKEKLVLIEVGEEQLIIAVGAAGISKLHTLAAPLQLEMGSQASTEDSDDKERDTKKSFRQQFEGLIKQ